MVMEMIQIMFLDVCVSIHLIMTQQQNNVLLIAILLLTLMA